MKPHLEDGLPRPSRWQTFIYWLSNDDRYLGRNPLRSPRCMDPWRVVPFVGVHLGCLGVFWTGTSGFAVLLAVTMYITRMFFITAFYHRYFAHRAFESSRPLRFVFAVLGCTAGQRGPLWWASHHRQHHIHSDTELDPQSRRRLRPRDDFVFDETDGTIRSSVARTGNSNTPATRGTKTSSYASRFRS